MTLVESLAVALTPDFAPVPRRAASDMVLNRHGLTPRGYVALHTGARHAINCWPLDHFYALAERLLAEIGRASCREGVCQYVLISVVAVFLKKKHTKTAAL